MPATTGKALVGGFDVFDQPLEAKKRTGYLPETPPLYPEMTVREYLMFVARIKGVASKAQRAQVDTSMEKTRVADVASRHCGKLSKGYRQRVGLAQAILHNPDVLILDEPTAGLDPKQIIETRDLIKSLAGDHTIVLSTHILPEVSQVCQRVVIINKGKVVAIDTPDNLTSRLAGAQSLYVQVDATSNADVGAALDGVPGVTAVRVADQKATVTGFEIECQRDRDIRRDLAKAIVIAGLGPARTAAAPHEPRRIFLQLTTQESTGAPAPDAARRLATADTNGSGASKENG